METFCLWRQFDFAKAVVIAITNVMLLHLALDKK